MKRWSIARAKAELSKVVEQAGEEPQELTNRGREVAVVVSKREWEVLMSRSTTRSQTPMESFLEFTEELRSQGDLSLRLPRRRDSGAREEPFEE